MSFQIKALEPTRLASFLSKSATPGEPATVRCLEANTNPGFPCRVSLRDAERGESVLALQYVHHDVDSPYRASGPIFVRASVVRQAGRKLARNEIPDFLRHRQLSLRAYDNGAMMIHAQVGPGNDLEQLIATAFADSAVAYLHIHNAAPGCFMCEVAR
ncbi:MAG: hypothetical protein DHS20C11_07580 [Lysobacteraceae bacterium]|nr:MAG: hypothetical protein DHS20C11_07580 [Xanthomonadaceae bacterium]